MVEVLFDADGKPVDYIFLETNAAFQRQTGLADAIGRRMREMAPNHEQHWFDIYGRIATTGEPQRFEQPAEALGRWYDVYAFRVGNPEQRHVAILFTDIAERKRAGDVLRESEERQGFLLKLSDALQPLVGAAEIQATTARLVGEHLGVDRAMYAEVDGEPGAETGIIRGQYVRPATGGAPSPAPFPERFAYDSFGAQTMAARYRGDPLVVADVSGNAAFSDAARAAWSAAGVRAAVVAPLAKGGRLVAEFGVHSSTPRAWTDAEVSLVQEVGERTWAAAERARAEAGLRESEEKYRSLFETMGQGYCKLELIRDERGKAVDQLYLELNPAFERLFGIAAAEAKGRKAGEVFPFLDPLWTETFEEVARTGRHKRFEHQHGPLQPWFEVFAYPAGGDQVIVLYEEITDRKRAEIAPGESEERQAFQLALGDALRLQPSAHGKIDVAAHYLGQRLGASRVLYAEFDSARGVADIFSGWLADGAEPFPAVLPLEDYKGPIMDDLQAGRTVRIDDVGALLHNPAYAGIAAIGVQALLSVPLVVSDRLVANLSVHQHEARHWTQDEVALVQEVAERLWADVVRARAEAKLRESEGRFRQFAETSSDVIWIRNADTMLYEYVSPAFETVYGGNLDELLSRNDLKRWAEFIHPEDRDRVLTALERVKQGERVTQEFRIRREPDGEVRWIKDSDFPLFDESGQVERVAGIGQDITEQRQTEDALRDREERLRLIIENARDYAIFTTDENGFVTDWHDGAEAVFGWSREEIVGRDGRVLYTPEDLAAGVPEDEMRTARDEGKAPDVRWHLCKDGSSVFIEGLVTPLHHDGHVGFLKIGRDATERHRSEEALRDSERHQRVLLAELQHRVRNTLAVVRSIARRTADRSEDVGDMIAHLDGRLNAFSRVQSAVTRNPAAGVDLESLIEDELLAVAAREGDHLRIKGPPIHLKPRAAESISLAVHELATNAVKYGALATGQGQIAVKWRRVGTDGSEWLELEWEESGLDGLEPPPREGFGHEMLRRTLPYDLRAETEIEFRPHGLRFTMSMPLGDQALAERRED